jgi:hypothetical protein
MITKVISTTSAPKLSQSSSMFAPSRNRNVVTPEIYRWSRGLLYRRRMRITKLRTLLKQRGRVWRNRQLGTMQQKRKVMTKKAKEEAIKNGKNI